jgi:DEAD/DEAH box helicase domain-containing protein
MTALVLETCPKCNNTLHEQYVNGSDVLLCLKCKYTKTLNTEPQQKEVVAPNNYGKLKTTIDKTLLKPVSELEKVDFAAYVKQERDCKLIREEIMPKFEPNYSQKSLDELITSSKIKSFLKNDTPNLYSYQEETIKKISNGENIVITAPTASGKTKSFLIPILDKIIQNPNKNKVSALFVYPTKALTADQVENMYDFTSSTDITIKQLDASKGDMDYRHKIISNPPDIIATNFDFISYHLARSNDSPFSKSFREMISNLKFIVVDETHQCKGFFGSNIKWILKRLQRLNPNLQFIASSATLDDAENFCNKLFPVKMTQVEGSGKRGSLTLQFVQTNTLERSLLITLTRLFATYGRQVLTFAKSRKDAELVAIDGSDKSCEIFVHRSGISDQKRAIVESALRKNEIKAVSCTPTLELGINIGNLDAVISSFTPYSRLTQRIGRAGRHGQDSNAIMVLDELNPIANYYIKNIQKYFDDDKLHSINFENPTVEGNQILLMAKETPLLESEITEFSNTVQTLCDDGKLIFNNGKYYCSDAGWKSLDEYSIRDMGRAVRLLTKYNYSEKEYQIGEIEAPIAYDWLYPGALYFHDKVTYRCKSFEKKGKYSKAHLIRENTSNMTLPIKFKDADIMKIYDSTENTNFKTAYGFVHVHQFISKYYEKNRLASLDKAEIHDVDVPLHFDFNTLGVAFGLNSQNISEKLHLSDSLTSADSSMHAAKHLLIHAAKMIVGAESSEIDGMIDPTKNTILLFDNSMNGGNGICKAIFEKQDLVIKRALELISTCDCDESAGCPKCTHWDGCSHFNENLEKEGARKILESMRITK